MSQTTLYGAKAQPKIFDCAVLCRRSLRQIHDKIDRTGPQGAALLQKVSSFKAGNPLPQDQASLTNFKTL